MLALCAAGYGHWHSFVMQVSPVLGGALFERYNVSDRCILLLSHSNFFFNPFFCVLSQLNIFPGLDKSGIGAYIGCLCCLSLAIGTHLSTITFCFSAGSNRNAIYSIYLSKESVSTSDRGVLNRLSVI